MGREKSLLDFKGRPLVEHIVEICSGLFEQTVIVTNKPDQYRAYGAELVSDVLDIRGPLTGIYSGLLRSRSEYSFVAACDMPFLNPGLIAYMGAIATGSDVVVPRYQGYLEPLHAVYHRRLLPTIESLLRKGDRRIRSMFDQIDVRYLTEDEIDRFDPLRRSFKNLNTPEEYKEAVCLDWECRN